MYAFEPFQKTTRLDTVVRSRKQSKKPLGRENDSKYFINLHQSLGNQFVQRMLRNNTEIPGNKTGHAVQGSSNYHLYNAPLKHLTLIPNQTKRTISQSNDKYEQEANEMAERVIRMPENGLIQRKCEEYYQEEILQRMPLASFIQKKGIDGGMLASESISNQIKSSKGSGQPLPKATRSFMESRFCTDFSGVRVHTGQQANEMNKSIHAKAFTHGSDIYMRNGQYNPNTSTGKHLLAHELTHVGQQRNNSNSSQLLQRWTAKEHGNITKSVIKSRYPESFSSDAVLHSAYYSGEMDLRGCNYLWYLTPKIKKGAEKLPVAGPIIQRPSEIPLVGPVAEHLKKAFYKLSDYEAPNHGEANQYKEINTDSTGKGKLTYINEERMVSYVRKAASIAIEKGLIEQVFIELGLALHVGQDRGAHDEGMVGLGHSKPDWKPDDPGINVAGYKIAKKRTEEVLDLFLTKLNNVQRNQLKIINLRNLAGPSPVILSGTDATSFPFKEEPELSTRTPLFYIGATKGMIKDKSGLPVRLGGVMPPLFNTGLMYMGDKKNTIAFDQQIGLRLMRITPRIYVDVLGGGVLGINFNDQSVMAGVSTAVHINYTGAKSDFGFMLNKIWDLTGNQDLLVIGVGGKF